MSRPVIQIDPGIRFGHPQIHGIDTGHIAGLVWAREDMDSIMDDYGLSRHEILLVCWWEWHRQDRQTRRGRWARRHDVFTSLAGHKNAKPVADLPDPPSRVTS